ncbi:MAG: hypothetical protein OXG68_12400 [Chloroflexi bacterium]|nr:hypothetical protein [Chloroflexota bacterium]
MIPPQTLIRVFLLLLYVPVCFIVFRRLMPRLSQVSRRLAAIPLAAHLVVIVVSLELQPSSSFEYWLWHLDREWNIPSTLASIQLALVGAVAIAAAWLAGERRPRERLYLLAIGLLFLIMARDEYGNLHESIPHWEWIYAALGAALVVTTLLVAWPGRRLHWIWHGCFLAGLALSGIGALAFEAERQFCGLGDVLIVEPCLDMYFIEESMEFAGIWLALVALLGQFSLSSPAPTRRVRLALYVWPVIWLLVLIPSGYILPITSQALAQPAAIEFESGWGLQAYRIEGGEQDLSAHLFLSSRAWDDSVIGYSLHLVDQVRGNSIVSHDTYLHQRLEFLLAPGYLPVYRQWSKLTVPAAAVPNRALWITLALWRAEDGVFLPLPVIASGHQQLNETQVILGEFVLKAAGTPRSMAPVALFENGFALEQIRLPESAQVGQTLDVTIWWRSAKDETEDLAQFLHFVRAGSGEWWGYDQQPLGPRLPTRLWYRRLADSETWAVPLPPDLKPGRYQVFTGLYRLNDQKRVPASDADGAPFVDARAPLGAISITA